MPSIFPFVEKEGKFFAPIVTTVPNVVFTNGEVSIMGDKIQAGTKGVFAKVRMVTNERGGAELFAVNTEWFASSN